MAALDYRRLRFRPDATPPSFPLPQFTWQGKPSREPLRHCRDCGGKFVVRSDGRPRARGAICPFCLSEHVEAIGDPRHARR